MTAASPDIAIPRRGRGRPRKEAVPKAPARPAHRPRLGFLESDVRFAVAVAFWLNAGGLKWRWAKEVGAIVSHPNAVIGHMPRRDGNLIDLALRNRHLAGNLSVVMVLRPELRADDAEMSRALHSAVRRVERSLKRLDADATRWVLRSATTIQMLRAPSPHARLIAFALLVTEGWPEWLVERIRPIDL